MSLTPSQTQFLTALSQFLNSDSWSTDPSERLNFGRDWTRVFVPNAFAVVWPRSTTEVSQILKLCSQYLISIVPSGGRTGLAGGAVAMHGELVLNLSKMNRVEPLNLVASTVRAQAGAVTEKIHELSAVHNLTWPIDLAAKGSSQIGGNIATNAGGVRVIRYGHTRHWVQSLEVVLMNGEILELNGELEKNNTGYDLRQLMIGSEGTLGVITAATLKLTRLPKNKRVFFFALSDMGQVLALLQMAKQQTAPILAFECLTRACLEAVCEKRGFAEPLGAVSDLYVLLEVELEDSTNAELDLEKFLAAVFDKKIVDDGTLAQSAGAARQLWQYREGITESLALKGMVYKNDLALPLKSLEAFVSELFANFKNWYQNCELFVFGHIGDGNLHINVLKPENMGEADFLSLCEKTNEALFTLVKKYKGSIAAEHGIGLLKKKFLAFSRSPVEIELFKQIKKCFDPANLLNPGKII